MRFINDDFPKNVHSHRYAWLFSHCRHDQLSEARCRVVVDSHFVWSGATHKHRTAHKLQHLDLILIKMNRRTDDRGIDGYQLTRYLFTDRSYNNRRNSFEPSS